MKSTILTALALTAGLASAASADSLTIYSGRGEALVAPLIAQFEATTGIKAEVRYAGTAELANLLMEEGANSPADVFWSQDGGALGVMAPHFHELPASVNEGVLPLFRNAANKWVATTGRSRVLVYSTERVEQDALPASIQDLTDERYKGRVAWAPGNASFQAFVTAMRVTEGDEATRGWLDAMKANDAQTYRNNGTQIEAIAAGEVDFGLVNNYYLGRYTDRDAEFPVAQGPFQAGDIGNLVNVAGAGILESSDNKENAQKFIDFLLSPAAQQYATLEGNEYPVVPGVIADASLPPLETLLEVSPQVDLDKLTDLEGTLAMLRDAGLL
ncbi:MAG: iron ABC transporter substrate-binding protein [Paracoccus sp. (in: a-proteobacteria)]|nr:iron ABC transporter substrate-binding protein [Paracoccus sp. (in: a-proteobacteria)]